jgi:hypothetical protein
MSGSRQAFDDDQKEYERLCRKYGERPESDGVLGSHPYSDHAQKLKERDRKTSKS